MKDVIELSSRHGRNYLLKQSKGEEESKTYLLKSDSSTLRVGFIDKDHQFVDPSGGPMIIEGEILEDINARVKSIDFKVGIGCLITFE